MLSVQASTSERPVGASVEWNGTTNHLRVADNAASRTIATILRHDAKVTSYKLARFEPSTTSCCRSPTPVARGHCHPAAILAEYWIAYYWPFVDPQTPISQGPHARGAA